MTGQATERTGKLDLTIIIAAKNASDVIGHQLDALVAQEWSGGWEIVVADNGSTDDTAAIVRSYDQPHPNVRLVDASDAPGAGHARNAAMAQSNSDAFAFCDADDVVEPGWVAAMGEALREHECVGGRNLFDLLNPPWLQSAFYAEPPDRLETFAGVFPFAATCNLGVHRDVIDNVGGFDESFRTGEDIELCLRIWAGGHTIAFLPRAIVQYRYRPSLKTLWLRSRDYGAVGPAIARKLAEMNAPTPPRVAGVKTYIWLVRRLPTLRTKQGRARWLVVAGGKLGRLTGSVKHHHLYL